MSEALQLLLELQGIDQQRRHEEQMRAQAEEDIRNLEAELLRRQQALADFKKEQTQAATEQKHAEMDLASQEAEIQKHQAELNKVKTNEAYRALLSEIEQARRKKEETEERVLQSMEKVEALARRIRQAGEELKEFQAQAERQTEARRQAIRDCEAKIADLKIRREEIAAKVRGLDENLLRKYERVQEVTGDATVLVPIATGGKHPRGSATASCGGCGSQLTAQVVDDVKSGRAWEKTPAGVRPVACRQCSRLLYAE